MKKNFAIICSVVVLVITSCGPAAEDRQAMLDRAKVFQDSIANVIKSSMDEAASPVDAMPAVDSAALKAAANATVK